MKIKASSLICVLTLALTLFYSQPVCAASTLSLLSSGDGGFSLQGVGMENVAALDVTINYETSTLSNPRVMPGVFISGALMQVNPNVPGTVRMLIITTSPIKGDGTIATLAFDQTGNSPGRIIAINASVANINGDPLPVLAQIVNSPNETEPSSITPSNAGTRSDTGAVPAPSGQQGMIVGIVPSGASAGSKIEEPSAAPEVSPEPVKELEVVSQETASRAPGTEQEKSPSKQEKNIYSQKSVLERFGIYTGARSAKALTELFNQEPLIGFRQVAPVVLSDGKALVKISFIAMTTGKKKPDVKVSGATLLSLKKDTDNTNTWIAELRPDKKAVSATLAVSQEKVNMEFPIVVAPAATVDLDKSGSVTEADFMLFLRDRGTAKNPKFDLNGDGKRDFVDEYVFTANYIIKKPVVIK